MLKKIMICAAVIFTICCTVTVGAQLIKPTGEHPYVYINNDFISGLRNEDGEIKEEYAASYKYIKSVASKSLGAQPSGGYLSASVSNHIICRALMYALGEFDLSHARETVEYTLKYLEKPLTSKPDSISMYKDFGENGIMCGSLVYDWCHSALTSEEKVKLAGFIKEMYIDTNDDGSPNYPQPCRADNIETAWSDIAYKSVGQPLLYNSVACVALYDVCPELFNAMMPKIQGSMAEAVKVYGTAGALSDGSISYSREYYAYCVRILLKRLGGEEEELYELYGDQSSIGYKMLYARLPYGAVMKHGDDSSQSNYILGAYTNAKETEVLGILANIYDNEYFRFQYLKENYDKKSYMNFLLFNCEVSAKLPDDLPLAYQTGAPRSEILARTSWQDGINSPAVSAYMNMNERRSGDHDHGDIGNFQLYYKGPLTMPSGVYNGTYWGYEHWRNYYSRTVAANCVTVYDPDEVFTFGAREAEANDGGQEMVSYKGEEYVYYNLADNLSDENLRAVNEGTYIGPNRKTPAFSFIKGDITNAYSDKKMESYKRSMVFMDTFNNTYPAAMIVFDRVVSTQADFKKKWLLQAVSNPEIDGNKITITNTQNGANGKLVNKTLLPQNVEIKAVGGIDKFISDNTEYAAPASTACEAYRSGYRLEVSPLTERKEDLFLNAMYVTDADGNAEELPMIYESTDEFVGVTTLDRMVMFSKNAEVVSNKFTLSVRNNNNNAEMLCMICDVMPGKWAVKGNNLNLILQSEEKSNCLVFSALPGTYEIEIVDSSAEVTHLQWDEAKKEKIGDFAIKLNETYMYLPDETLLCDDIPYISAETCMQLGEDIKTEVSGDTVIIKRQDTVSEIKAGDIYYTFNGTKTDIKYPAIVYNEKIYLPVSEMGAAFAVDTEYIPAALTLKIESGENVSSTGLLVPLYSTGFEKSHVLCDGVSGEEITFASFAGNEEPVEGTTVTYCLGEQMKQIEKIEVSGTDSVSKFDVFTSADGYNFNLLKGEIVSLGDELSALIPQNKVIAKYVKFTPNSIAKIKEFAVYGSDENTVCTIINENVSTIDIHSDFTVQTYIKSGFESAALYIGGNLVYEFDEDEALGEVYTATVSSEQLSEIGLGAQNVRLSVIYEGKATYDVKNISLTEGKVYLGIVNLGFGQNDVSALKTFHTTPSGKARFSSNAWHTESINFGKYKGIISADKTVYPYFALTELKKYDSDSGKYIPMGDGVYEARFDLHISGGQIMTKLEPRTSALEYPASGSQHYIFFDKQGSFEVTFRFDTINEVLRVYIRDINLQTGERTEKAYLYKELYFSSLGLGQIRLTFGNRNEENVNIAVDNFTLDYYEISNVNSTETCFYVFENKLYTRIGAGDFGEEIKVIKVLKKDEEIISIDIESVDGGCAQSLLFETPDDFFTSTDYRASVFIVSADNLLNVLEKKTF